MSAVGQSPQQASNTNRTGDGSKEEQPGPIERLIRKIVAFVVNFFKRILCCRSASSNSKQAANQTEKPARNEPIQSDVKQRKIGELLRLVEHRPTPDQILAQFDHALGEREANQIYNRYGNGNYINGRDYLRNHLDVVAFELKSHLSS